MQFEDKTVKITSVFGYKKLVPLRKNRLREPEQLIAPVEDPHVFLAEVT
jgi:hypothetical protein